MYEKISKELFKKIAKLNQKKYRLENKQVLIEGERLISQVLLYLENNTLHPDTKFYYLLIEENSFVKYHDIIDKFKSSDSQIKIYTINEQQAQQISETMTSQNIFAVSTFIFNTIKSYNRLVYLDSISDPGNLGTIFRTATSFDIDGLILSDNCCELSNPKLIRASMGSVFYQPILLANHEWLLNRQEKLYISVVNEGVSLNNITFPKQPYILVIGSEATGVDKSIFSSQHTKVKISIKQDMESLNVAIATGIFMQKMFNDSKKSLINNI